MHAGFIEQLHCNKHVNQEFCHIERKVYIYTWLSVTARPQRKASLPRETSCPSPSQPTTTKSPCLVCQERSRNNRDFYISTSEFRFVAWVDIGLFVHYKTLRLSRIHCINYQTIKWGEDHIFVSHDKNFLTLYTVSNYFIFLQRGWIKTPTMSYWD